MAEITKVYRQSMPKMKLVGRRYTDADRVDGFFAAKWGEWMQNGLFAPLQMNAAGEKPFEECDAPIGMSRVKEGEPFEYWIGVFMPLDASVPTGYESLIFDESDIAVCWVYGKEPDVYTCCGMDAMAQAGMTWKTDANGVRWCFERYAHPRYTTPDEKGNVTLDMCFYI